ncbi:allergen Asp F4-like [Penicillium taxi]|uniref:allergen Asp F4-like n=1 Tax=Penicillium taxi TaxID=168475 RepID=UPI002544EB20|nr:allergen Asp F4-like [Penicillium taxi]KAJ5899033.1 allergen Asp F4-like [Penicillium taxi]
MLFSKSFLLLVAATTGAVAHGSNHAHWHIANERRQAAGTVTVTTTNTVIYCPCDDSYSTITPTSTTALPSTTEVATTALPSTTEVATTTALPSTTEVEVTTSSTTTSSSSTSTSTLSTSTTSTSTSTGTGYNADWTSIPSSYSTSGFGTATNSSGSGDTYTGNVGSPYGSNIIIVDGSEANEYKYVLQFQGSNTEEWTVVFWNKIGPDGAMDGWYGNGCLTFTLAVGETKGGWAAAKGTSIPTDSYGGYAATWGEFDFGSTINDGWSGFDVSAIQAQAADLTVQGMKICSQYNVDTCSTITADLVSVINAYTKALASADGIGGNLVSGPVRLAVHIDFS